MKNNNFRMELRAVALLLLFVVSGCMSDPTNPVPEALVEKVSVSGLEGLRTWTDETGEVPKGVIAEFANVFRDYNLRNDRKFNVLALSGGGQSGAYGAGVLNGWSASGTRPVFDVVTGISTGAIIAPFAFLGQQYDPILKEIYTTTTTKDIGKIQLVQGLAGGEGVLQPKGFEVLLAKYVTTELVDKIAVESAKGRVLLIGTTNLEAERGVIWNIGLLAVSDYPEKVELLRDIIRASASIPGAFPPVRIDVEYQGEAFSELHADGGVTEQVFLYPSNVSIAELERALGYQMKKQVFVIRNAKLESSYAELKPVTVRIVERSLNTLIKIQGRDDVRRIERIAKRDGMAFRLAAIPPSFRVKSSEFFDPDYMRPLFELGYQHGLKHDQWMRQAP